MIENSLSKLVWEFQIKSKVLMEVCNSIKIRITPFETYRSRARQARLYANKKPGQAVAKPGQSYHERGKAVDWVFTSPSWQISWVWSYPSVHFVWFMCWVTPIYKNGQLVESCHLQDDGTTIARVMQKNSTRYGKETKKNQDLLSLVNTTFRKYWYK